MRGEGEEGDSQEAAQEPREEPGLWNRNLSAGTVQEASSGLGSRGWGQVRRRPPALAHTHSPILARLATRIHRATR